MQRRALAALAILSFGTGPAWIHAQHEPFTVTDSIQMVHFNDPDGRSTHPVWDISPDGSTAIIVTTKGIIASNVVESTLWTLDLRAIAESLEVNESHNLPSLKRIFTVRGQLHAFQPDSYGSLITKSRWSLDSKGIYMLIEQHGGHRELDKIDLLTRHKERLSQDGESVTDYEIDSRGALYSTEQFQNSNKPEEEEASDVVDTVTGTSIFGLLWPSTEPTRLLFRSDSDGVRPIAPMPNPAVSRFSISPDGSKVITLVPVDETPAMWKRYVPSRPEQPLYRSGSSVYPVLEYDVIDLHTHSRHPLLGSPSGRSVGYDDNAQVVWSSKGNYALVTNTFLPFDHESQEEQNARQQPCAAAFVGVTNGRTTCIVFARSSKVNESTDSWAISGIRFGRTEHDAVISLSWRGRHKEECYSSTGGTWLEDSNTDCESSIETPDRTNRSTVQLKIVQSLDEPPSLYAEDVRNGRIVRIWNPNPQIAEKVSGTTFVYHWLDKDRREWTGGLMLPHGFRPDVRYPLVIQTHGFRSNEFLVDGVWTTAMAARPLAALGFVVLQVEDKYDDNSTAEEAQLHVNGYIAAIDQLAKSGIIDPKRVGIVGFSRTCWFVEESLLEYPDRFAAAVMADGVDQSYLQYLLIRPELPAIESERYNGGEPIGKGLEMWIKSAPDFRLSEEKTPLRLQAMGPPYSSLLTEWEIYASLRIQNKPVDMVYFPFGQHVLQNPAELMASEQGDVDWFRYWLRNEEDYDPAKINQYHLWDKLRKGQSEIASTINRAK